MGCAWLFALCFLCWFSTSTATGIECRRDVQFIVESNNTLCMDTERCNYCWGQFIHDFVQPINDISELNINMHVYHSNEFVYGCELELTRAQTCVCASNKWSFNASIPNLLRVAQDGFLTMREDFSDTIMLFITSHVDNADEIARYLHSHRVQVVVIAIGHGQRADVDQLKKIATDEYSLFQFRDNQHLLQSVYDVRKAVCRACKKDVTFALAWQNELPAPDLGWCAGGMISDFVRPLDSEIRVSSLDWGVATEARGCEADWKQFTSQCACRESRWPTLTTSAFYEHIVKKFFEFRELYQNVIVFFADRKLGFKEIDMTPFRDNSVLVVTVWVGDQLEGKELQQLASSSNVSYAIDSWNDVNQIIPTLRHYVCFDEALQPAFRDCGDRTDLTFLVDLSRSMTGHVVEMKTFLTSLTESLNISHGHHHVNVITFSSGAKVLLQDAHDVTSVNDVIKGLVPEFGSSSIADALLQATILTRTSSRILSDSGVYCPKASVLILSDGLYGDRKGPLNRVRTLNQMGVKVSFVSFGHEESVYMSEAMVSPGLQVHEFESSWNTSSFDNLKQELINGVPPATNTTKKKECFFQPKAVIFLFYVEVQDAIDTTLKEFVDFLSTSDSKPDTHVIYPRDLSRPTLSINASFIPISSSLAGYLEEAIEIDIVSDQNTTYIIVADNMDDVPSPIFTRIRRLQQQGSKVMAVGTAAKVNHDVLERIASIPRYALSSQATWDLQIPGKMWTRYCDACGFTKLIDIAFYVEASKATYHKWKTITNFLLTASASFPISKRNVQISITTFSNQIRSDNHFDSYNDKMDLFRQIYDITPQNEAVNMTSALINIQTAFNVTRGARPEAVKVLVLILDSELVSPVDESNDIQTIWFDMSGRETSEFRSKYLDSSDTYVKTEGIDDILMYQNELHDMICRAIYVE